MTIRTQTPEFGQRLISAVAEEIYPYNYPRQSVSIKLSERSLGSQAHIFECARHILLVARVHESSLDEIVLADAIHQERWPHYGPKRPFQYLPHHERQELLALAHAVIDCILSGGYHD